MHSVWIGLRASGFLPKEYVHDITTQGDGNYKHGFKTSFTMFCLILMHGLVLVLSGPIVRDRNTESFFATKTLTVL